jgi:glycosyltransferase involved in cell wall biosynthesis
MAATKRPVARGKSLFLGDEKLYVRGVTYGTFGPDEETDDFPNPRTVARDFARMAAIGVNAVRTYTVPPTWLLDLALQHRLRVMVGLPWEEHVTFLDDAERIASIRERVREGVRSCAGHPAVLCYAIGNEIPASIVRWHGRSRIERFLEQLYRDCKDEDPGALVTYVNYPSTEYLQLPFVDIVCFNVFLESGPQFEAYLARLQNICGNRPLIVTETGLDSRRHSQEAQARALDWQVRSAFACGSAGVFVFSWTDEWHRGGHDIDDWDFGLVDRDRRPKRALAAVSKAFSELPFPTNLPWPRISVIVCAYNSEDTLPDCLNGLRALDYSNYEVIVVNDGSTDRSAEIASEYGFRLIDTENRGLACARNAGLEAATGEIVAYIDSDASPEPQWLSHLAISFMRSQHVGIGGPNIPPEGDGRLAECVGHAPGGPTHVLLSDRLAEHIPGCNMAFRKESLDAIGGFDPQFRIAGDDVDICWQLQNQGGTIGYSAGAVVWHHRRNSIKAYAKQQYEYGKAEALLEGKWPERYNSVGHLAWSGRVYGAGVTTLRGWRRWRIYYGTWGTGLFQSIYQRSRSAFSTLAVVPEWFLVILALAGLSALGILWSPLLLALPLLLLASGLLVYESSMAAARSIFRGESRSRFEIFQLRAVTALLHMIQPIARLGGRLRYGLAPWRRRAVPALALPRPRTNNIWSEEWLSPDQRLAGIDGRLRQTGCPVLHGSEYDRWDLEVRGGIMGATRLRLAVEEHGAGTQLVRLRSWPRYSRAGILLTALLGTLAAAALLDGAAIAGAILGAFAFLLAASAVRDCAAATGVLLYAIAEPRTEDSALESPPEEPEEAPAWATTEAEAAYDANGGGLRSTNGNESVPASTSVGELPSRARVARLPEPK